jgi:broad specificity phosphatase PhoE
MHLYLSHPQVKIDPSVAVPDWGLSDLGRQRTETLAGEGWLRGFRRIVSSTERKAVETAEILAEALDAPVDIRESMHENDRSATGFLPPPEFEATADLFFRHPEQSIRGWERAADAQARVVGAVVRALAEAPGTPTIFVGHGGVGTLLQCFCAGRPISRAHDQPAGGGNHFAFDIAGGIVLYGWRSMETPPETLP